MNDSNHVTTEAIDTLNLHMQDITRRLMITEVQLEEIRIKFKFRNQIWTKIKNELVSMWLTFIGLMLGLFLVTQLHF